MQTPRFAAAFCFSAFENSQIRLHGWCEPRVQGFANQGVADRYFGQERNRLFERAEIGLAQVVPRIHAQARRARPPSGPPRLV